MELARAAPQLLVPELARLGRPPVLVVKLEVGLRPAEAPRVVGGQQAALPVGPGTPVEEQRVAARRGQ